MNTQKFRIMAVIDPTRVDQWALKKALSIARNREGSKMVAYLSVHSDAKCDDAERLRTVEVTRHKMWLEQILTGFVDEGVAIDAIVEWNADWRRAVSEVAEHGQFDLVVKQASGRPDSLTNSDRQLIRSLPDSALLLVRHDPRDELKKVLVAVDFNATDASHTALNEAIMDLGKRIRGEDGKIELHSISAYPESDKFVHPTDVAKVLGITRSQAHVRQGSAAEVIPDMANRIGADLVVVGSVGRRGLSGITVGNTAEKILMDIDADVLVIVREQKRQRNAA
ncbi:MAG: universal stress protein [Gammaproteobacteria bacterium]|nr:universal stress protein [Gammaproteobacteria bacterium]MDH4313318.1 universal stress protein [Gammaproteobacteria bacterium]MDH5214689.1 universal stress protein [Gammaproteobacteria bacterium]MDH5500869.1 universal stress protein [Gammaproteobacteria bacterium]